MMKQEFDFFSDNKAPVSLSHFKWVGQGTTNFACKRGCVLYVAGRYRFGSWEFEIISQTCVFSLYKTNGSLLGFMIYQTEKVTTASCN